MAWVSSETARSCDGAQAARVNVLVAKHALTSPLQDVPEIAEWRRDRDGVEHGRIVLANGNASHGEPARLQRDVRGRPLHLPLAGSRLTPEPAAKELQACHSA